MKRLSFVQLYAENKDSCAIFEKLMWQYTKELEEHRDRATPTEVIARWIKGIIQIQGDRNRHLELCYDGGTLIGFLCGKVDRPEHKGFKKIGYGYIMEFFVLPEHRRNGYGKEMYLRLEELFRQDGVKWMYLTADPVTGKPFWKSMGFVNTGEISTENKFHIYEKNIPTDFNIASLTDDYSDLQFICDLLTDPLNASSLHLKMIPDDEIPPFRAEMREALISSTPNDELNHIIRKGVVPVAWLKLNGLSNDSLWISMLVVHEKYRKLGVGMFTLNFVDEFARTTGRRHIYIYTTADNKAAQSLYKKVGYAVTSEAEQQYGDGSRIVQYTLHKEIISD